MKGTLAVILCVMLAGCGTTRNPPVTGKETSLDRWNATVEKIMAPAIFLQNSVIKDIKGGLFYTNGTGFYGPYFQIDNNMPVPWQANAVQTSAK